MMVGRRCWMPPPRHHQPMPSMFTELNSKCVYTLSKPSKPQHLLCCKS